MSRGSGSDIQLKPTSSSDQRPSSTPSHASPSTPLYPQWPTTWIATSPPSLSGSELRPAWRSPSLWRRSSRSDLALGARSAHRAAMAHHAMSMRHIHANAYGHARTLRAPCMPPARDPALRLLARARSLPPASSGRHPAVRAGERGITGCHQESPSLQACVQADG